MSKSKVTLRVNTIGAKAGDQVEVDKEVADALVADGNAFKSETKADKQ